MAPQKVLKKVLKRFNSLLFFSREEKEARLQMIMHASPEGLAELLNVFEQAFARQNKYLQAICENDPEFAKNFYVMMKTGMTKAKTRKELKGVRKEVKGRRSGAGERPRPGVGNRPQPDVTSGK